MQTKQSAGILLFKKTDQMQVFLVHPGGPFWKNKDDGVWTIPKGEFREDEEVLAAAIREFKEETGSAVSGSFIELKPIKQKSGKVIFAWALEGNIDHEKTVSNTFEIEWPPRSGKKQSFPEIDKSSWFDTEEAKRKIHPSQIALINELIWILNSKK